MDQIPEVYGGLLKGSCISGVNEADTAKMCATLSDPALCGPALCAGERPSDRPSPLSDSPRWMRGSPLWRSSLETPLGQRQRQQQQPGTAPAPGRGNSSSA